jgi:hypothetical protein
MDHKFAALVETLAPKLECLLAAAPASNGDLPRNMPASGVYLFTENGRHLYVGRSNVLRGRYGGIAGSGLLISRRHSHSSWRARKLAGLRHRIRRARTAARG